jgi:hypothetical protein
MCNNVGGQVKGASPETLTDQMEKAGFALERTDTSFKANRLYIYILRPRSL